jgi:Poly A polymerase head domain/Probable RNA and SrmB- binding site of polymerase A
MDELVREVLAGEEAWFVGGAVRDELLNRRVLDVDVVCRDPARAARAYAKVSGGAPFALSEKHASWRVVNPNWGTVDFTPVHGTIEADLLRRDFTINAIALPVSGGEHLDPCGGSDDLQLREIRAVSESVFDDDPLRLVRAVRLADELGFTIAPMTRQLIVDNAELVTRAAGERVLAELDRLSGDGYRLLAELGLLERLGGSLDGDAIDRLDSPRYRLVAAFRENTRRLPVSVETRRYARSLLEAEPPADDSPRAVYRFRRMTEPWASDALVFVGRPELIPAVEKARSSEPKDALVRGDELGLPPGPEIGRLLDRIAEERAAGTISTRDEALELARREARQ